MCRSFVFFTDQKPGDLFKFRKKNSAFLQKETTTLVGGFKRSTHVKHMIVKMGSSSPNGAESKNMFELPPPSYIS